MVDHDGGAQVARRGSLRRGALGLVLAASVLVMLVPTPVAGQVPDDGAGEVDLPAGADIVTAYEEALAGEADAQRLLDEAALRVLVLEEELIALDARIAVVEEELAAAQTRASDAEAALAVAEAERQGTEDALAAEQQRLRDQAVAAYVGGAATPMPDYAAALQDAASLNDLAKSKVYGEVVVADRERIVARYQQLKADAEVLRDEADRAEDEATAARDGVAGRAADLAGQRERLADTRQASADAVAERQGLGIEIEGRRRAYELRYSSVLSASDGLTALLRERQAGQAPLFTTYQILLNPILGGEVVSAYGPRLHPILGFVRLHKGVDIDGAMGTPMRAPLDGTVVVAEERGGYGLTVVIDHGNQLATLSAHMSSVTVAPGQQVRTGDVVGAVGSTGLSTGPHCHFEVRILGVPVNAVPYLMKSEPPLPVRG
jgi:murein DD-endopeptidase MepM/ murein hydrolase activator NlpD